MGINMPKKEQSKKDLAIGKIIETIKILEELYSEKATNPGYTAIINLQTTILEIKKI